MLSVSSSLCSRYLGGKKKSPGLLDIYSEQNANFSSFVSTVGEFHVDLYTLPDMLIKMLWDFTAERGAL